MKKTKFKCCNCRRILPIRVEGQRYCGESACQKARKNAWRREKYAGDPDYRFNQRDSTKAWLSSVGGAAEYYRKYRKGREPPPERSSGVSAKSMEKNPLDESLFAQIASDLDAGANSDALSRKYPIKTGRYRISPERANSDAFWAEIRVISDG